MARQFGHEVDPQKFGPEGLQKFMGPLRALDSTARFLGAASELWTKTAAYSRLKKNEEKAVAKGKAKDDFAMRIAGHMVRNYAGTPNYRTHGSNIGILRAAFPFANIIFQGWERTWARATGRSRSPTGRGSATHWWVDATIYELIPQAITSLMLAGGLGDEWKRRYQAVSRHDMMNKLNFCFATSQPGKLMPGGQAGVFSLPHEESTKLLCSMLHMAIMASYKGEMKQFDQAFGLIADQMPAKNFWIEVAQQAVNVAARRDAYDSRGKPIVPNAERGVSRLNDAKRFSQWVYNNSGLQMAYSFDTESKTTLEAQVSAIPWLRGCFKITEFGYSEMENRKTEATEQRKRDHKFEYGDTTKELSREYFYLRNRDKKDRTQAQTERLVELNKWYYGTDGFHKTDEKVTEAENDKTPALLKYNEKAARAYRDSLETYSKRFKEKR
jgi:hypothetical protein